VEVLREEPIGLEAARRHQGEHLEQGLAEAVATRARALRKEPDRRVEAIDGPDIQTVDLVELRLEVRIRRERLDRRDALEAQLLAEVVVTRDAALAIAQHVDRSHVDDRAIGHAELLDE